MGRRLWYGAAVAWVCVVLAAGLPASGARATLNPDGDFSSRQSPSAGGGRIAPAAAWRSECADCPPIFGGGGSLALDREGRPHLVYGEDHLYHSWNDGTAWHAEVVDAQPQVGWQSSLALDLLDGLHVAYSGQGVLRYARFDGTTWQTATLDAAGQSPSIAVDGARVPGVAYISGTLRYAWYGPSGWYTETVDGRDLYLGVSQAMDPAGQPHLAYLDRNGTIWHAWHDGSRWYSESLPLGSHEVDLGSESLVYDGHGHLHLAYQDVHGYVDYAFFDGSAWYTETVSEPGDLAHGTALALDPQDRPHLAYTVYPNGGTYALTHAWRESTGWQRETVDTGYGASLVVDAAGRMAISYAWGNELRVAQSYGLGWQIEAVAEKGFVGAFPVLAMDGSERPHIIYRSGPENEAGALKYAWYDGAAWRYEIVDSDGNPGLWENGLVLDAGGEPHVVYYRWAAGTVQYAHRVSGTWQVEQIPGVDYAPSLALDAAGRPHVAIGGAGTVWYAYRDETGWHVEKVNDGGWGRTSLALDAQGYAHICYANLAYGLRYTWFDGSTWHSEDVAPGSGGATIDCSLALDAAGRPHMSYHAADYVRYAWHDGTRWYTETVGVSGSNLSAYTSLALDVQGHPRISYIANDYSGGHLRYAALDGSAWITETVGDAGEYPQGTSLALDSTDGPHVAYYETNCFDLRYAERVPGRSWWFYLPLVLKGL